MEECPTCMLYYKLGLNRCMQCKKGVCSDCLVQLVDPSQPFKAKCPFCSSQPLQWKFTGKRSMEDLESERRELQRIKAMERQLLDQAIAMEKERVARKKPDAELAVDQPATVPSAQTTQPQNPQSPASPKVNYTDGDYELALALAISLGMEVLAWRCPCCRRAVVATDTCDRCGNIRHAWTCVHCTHVNSGASTKCSGCGEVADTE